MRRLVDGYDEDFFRLRLGVELGTSGAVDVPAVGVERQAHLVGLVPDGVNILRQDTGDLTRGRRDSNPHSRSRETDLKPVFA